MRPTQLRAPYLGNAHYLGTGHYLGKRGAAILGRQSMVRGIAVAAIALFALPALASPKGTVAGKKAQRLNVISALETVERGDHTVITLRCSAKPLFSVFKLQRPPRLTIDLANAELSGIRALLDVDSWAVSQVATSQFRTSASTIARVMVSFRRKAHYGVRTQGRDVVITVMPYAKKPDPREHLRGLRSEARDARQDAKLARQAAAQARAEVQRLSKEAEEARREAFRSKTILQSAKSKMGRLKKSASEVQVIRRRLNELARRAMEARLEARRAKEAAAQANARSKVLLRDANRSKQLANRAREAAQRALKHAKKQQARQRKSAKAAPKPTKVWTSPRISSQAAIRNVSFANGDTFAEVRVRLKGKAKYKLHRQGKEVLLVLENAALPQLLRRTLDTRAYGGPIQAISSFVTNESTGLVYVKVDLDRARAGRLRRTADGLVWRFDKTSPGVAAPGAPRLASNAKVLPVAGAQNHSYRSTAVAAASKTSRFKRRRYFGRRIDLDFKDAGIHNILRLLSQVGNVNIITSDDVRGKVTIRMRNVPWDQALDVVLRAKGLGQVREGNLVRVAPLADLEKEREAELARLKQMAMLKPLETRLIPLSYAQAQSVLPKLRYTLSPRGKLTFDQRTNMIIARDIAANLNLMEKMIRNLDTQTPQVMIEARIIEARTSYTKSIGIQWGGAFAATSANGNSTGLAFPNQLGIGGGATGSGSPTQGILLGQDANPNFVVNMPAPAGPGGGGALGLTLGSISGTFNVNLRLSASESTGDIRIVSAPRITTLDNVQATIEQGVSIPFSQVSAAGVQTSFQDAKLSLNVKPHVTADGSVIMTVKVERNEPDFSNTGANGQPTVLKKQASTEMLVKDGDTAVIGGIYTTRDGRTWQKVPWFAEIPVIGWFFKQRSETSDREEVLIFITPRIINRSQSIGKSAG